MGKKIRKFNINRLSEKKKNYTVDEISQDYINSINLADNIAKLYNVKVFFFLQPAPFSRKYPVGIEKKYHKALPNNQKFADFKKDLLDRGNKYMRASFDIFERPMYHPLVKDKENASIKISELISVIASVPEFQQS